MAITLTRVLGDNGPSGVISIDIHQMKISKHYLHVNTLLFMLHHLILLKYYSGLMEAMQKDNKAQ